MKSPKHLWFFVYSVILSAFTIYVLLDTFVIPRVYTSAALAEESPMQSPRSDDAPQSPGEPDLEEDRPEQGPRPDDAPQSSNGPDEGLPQSPEITDTTYRDDNISIVITTYREHDTSIYLADILITSAEYLKTAFAQGEYGKNIKETTSEMADSNHAILAVNGDFYGTRELGYVLRNGILYRDISSEDREDLVIYQDGTFSVFTEAETTAGQLLSDGAKHVLSFGPALVTDGNISVSRDAEIKNVMKSNPRTAIGIVDDLHYLFVVSDGRTSESAGLSLYELAEFMQSFGAKIAYNLDGGGSSTMCFNGNVINQPTTRGKIIEERSVSDIVYIGY